MASPLDGSISGAEQAIGRLVERTSGHETYKYLGPTCLVHFESKQIIQLAPNLRLSSNYFVVASNQVLTKCHLEAVARREREKSIFTGEPSVEIVAEFPGMKDIKKIERKPLSKIPLDEVFELEGTIYVAVKPGRFGKSKFFSRALKAVDVEEGPASSSTSDQFHCSVVCDERTTTPRKHTKIPELSTRSYDLLKFDSLLACDETRLSDYFLRNEEKRFLTEDQFAEDEKPLGAIILSKENKFAGVLNFIDKRPAPVIFGTTPELDTGGFCDGPDSLHGAAGGKGVGEEHQKTEREMLGGASGGIYPLLDPQSKSKVRPEADNKAGIYSSPQPAATPSSGGLFVTGRNSTNFNKDEEDLTDSTTDPPLPELEKEKECPEEKDQGVRSSPIENSYRSVDFSNSNKSDQDLKGVVNLVDLPLENGKEVQFQAPEVRHPSVTQGAEGGLEFRGSQTSQVGKVAPDPQKTQSTPAAEIHRMQGPLGEERAQGSCDTQGTSQQTADLEVQGNGILPQERRRDYFPERHSSEQRRSSFPGDGQPRKEEKPPVKRTTSSAELSRDTLEPRRKYKLGDPLEKTLLDCLNLLEALCRCLDKEYKYGHCKCWKHIAEYFGIPEKEYQSFKCRQVHSPTEVMFEYLQSAKPNITVSDLKQALYQIERQDVIGKLIKYEKCDPPLLNNETLVSSLFDCVGNSDVIGEMAFYLDMQKHGLKDWSDLAPNLGITRAIFKSFEDSSTNNPTEELFEILEKRFPNLTIMDLISHLKAMERHDVVNAIKRSTNVTESSVIKELIADDVMDEVCDLFNTKKRATKVMGLRNLGRRLRIKKETLDDILQVQEEIECPTEALIRHLGGRKPWLTLTDFVWAIHTIDRPDALVVLETYLPDHCIPDLLASCHCERCQPISGEL